MYRQHFGLRRAPLDKDSTDLWDDGALAQLTERFQWLLTSPGIGLLTGEPGVGKTAALRHLTRNLNQLLCDWLLWFCAAYREQIRRCNEPWAAPPREPPSRHRIDDPF
jgi:hypothetical protein